MSLNLVDLYTYLTFFSLTKNFKKFYLFIYLYSNCSCAHLGLLPLRQVLQTYLQLPAPSLHGRSIHEQGLRLTATWHVPKERGPQGGHQHGSGHPPGLRQPVLQEPPARDGPLHLGPGPLRRRPVQARCQLLRLQPEGLQPGLCLGHDQVGPHRGQDGVQR